jgi:hypothetical protein
MVTPSLADLLDVAGKVVAKTVACGVCPGC